MPATDFYEQRGAPQASMFLNFDQIHRLGDLGKYPLVIQSCETSKAKFGTIDRFFGELYPHLAAFLPNETIYLIGGGASWVISGNSEYRDLDFCIVTQECPFEKFEFLKQNLISLIGDWTSKKRGRFGSQQFRNDLWDAYFYKSSSTHLCLSFGNIDIKILKAGGRSHLFDHDGVGINLCWEELSRSRIELIPGAVQQDLLKCLDAVFNKKLILSQPETAYNFHFRVFQKFTDGFFVEADLIQRALYEMADAFQKNPRFREVFRFFCRNHLTVENAQTYKLNLFNALQVSKQIEEKIKHPLRRDLEELLDERMGLAPQVVLWDPYQELLSLIAGIFFANSKNLYVIGHHLHVEQKYYFLPKPLPDCLFEAITELPLDASSCMDILENWFWMTPQPPFLKEIALSDLNERFFPAVLAKSFNQLETLQRIYRFTAPFGAFQISLEDPLGFLINLYQTGGLTFEVVSDIFPKVMYKRTYPPEKIINFFGFFGEQDFLEQKRYFLRSYFLQPEKRNDFLNSKEVFQSLFGSLAFDEMSRMYPSTFFDFCSNWIEDENVYVETKLPLIEWIKKRGFVKNLTQKGQERAEIVDLSISLEKASDLFIKKACPQKLISWLVWAYENHPEATLFFEKLYDQAYTFTERRSYHELIVVLHTASPFCDRTLNLKIEDNDSQAYRAANAFLQIVYNFHQLDSLDAVAYLKRINPIEIELLTNNILEIFRRGLDENDPALIEIAHYLGLEMALKPFVDFVDRKLEPIYKEKAILYFLEDIKLPNIKSLEFAQDLSRLFGLATPLYSHPKKGVLIDPLVKTFNEKQILNLIGHVSEQFLHEIFWLKGQKTRFIGSINIKEHYADACLYFSKSDRSRLKDAKPIFDLLLELIDIKDIQSKYFPLLIELGSSGEFLEKILLLTVRSKKGESDLEAFAISLLEKAGSVKLPYILVEEFRKKFKSPLLSDMLEGNCGSFQLKDGIGILKKEGTAVLKKNSRFKSNVLQALQKEPRWQELEELIGMAQAPQMVDEEFVLTLAENALHAIDPKNAKYCSLVHSWIQNLLVCQDYPFEAKILSIPVVGEYIEENVAKITHVDLRARIFKRVFEKKEFSFTKPSTLLLQTFFGKKNIDKFFAHFIDPFTFLKLVESCTCDPHLQDTGTRWLFPLLTLSPSQPSLQPPIIKQAISLVMQNKMIHRFSLPEKIEMAVLFQNVGGVLDFEKTILPHFEEELALLKSHQIDWLINEMRPIAPKSSKVASSSMRLLTHILYKKDMVGQSLELIDLMAENCHLRKADFTLFTQLILEKDLDQPDLVAKCIEFFDRYEGTLFFPGKIFEDDLAFLYLVSQGEAHEESFKKMEPYLPVYREFSRLSSIKNIAEITKKIVSHLRFSTPKEKFENLQEYFNNFYKILESQKGYETAWLRLHLIGNSLVRKKNGLELSLEEIVSGLTQKETIQLIRLKILLIRDRLIESTVEVYHLEHIRATVAYATESGVGDIFKEGQLEAFLKAKNVESSSEDIDFFKKYQNAIHGGGNYEFFIDIAFLDLTFALRSFRQFFDKASSLDQKQELAAEIASVLETYVLTTQFGLNKAQVDLKLVNRIFKENLKIVPQETVRTLALFIFKIYVTLTGENPGFFATSHEDLENFCRGVLGPHTSSGHLSAASLLPEILRFFNHANKTKDHLIANMAAELLTTVYHGKMGGDQKCFQKMEILHLGDHIQVSYINIIINLLERFDEKSYLTAGLLNEQFKEIYGIQVPKLRKLLDDDQNMYSFGPETFERALPGITLQMKGLQTDQLKIEFLRRLGGRLLFLIVHKEGFCHDKFLWMINLFFEEQTKLLVQKNLEQQDLLTLVQFVNNFYTTFVLTLLEISERLKLSDLKTRKLYSSILLIAIRKMSELVAFYPKLRTPNLSTLFDQAFPFVKKMLEAQIGFVDKDRESLSLRTDGEVAFRNLLLNCKRTFHAHRVELIAVTVLQYAYVGILEKELKTTKSLEKKECIKLDELFFVMSLDLKDVANAVFTTPREFTFVLENFLVFIDHDPLLSKMEKKQVIESFLPWMEEKFSSIQGFKPTEKLREDLSNIRKRLCDMGV